jgi:hypothetical protein
MLLISVPFQFDSYTWGEQNPIAGMIIENQILILRLGKARDLYARNQWKSTCLAARRAINVKDHGAISFASGVRASAAAAEQC